MTDRMVIDEMVGGWQAVCWADPGRCTWCSPTVYADQFFVSGDPMDAAFEQATIEGDAHLAERHPE